MILCLITVLCLNHEVRLIQTYKFLLRDWWDFTKQEGCSVNSIYVTHQLLRSTMAKCVIGALDKLFIPTKLSLGKGTKSELKQPSCYSSLISFSFTPKYCVFCLFQSPQPCISVCSLGEVRQFNWPRFFFTNTKVTERNRWKQRHGKKR